MADALTTDWHETRVAGRVSRHTAILRDLAHELSNDPKRLGRPRNAAEAEMRLRAHVELQREKAPHTGLGASTGRFLDHIATLLDRYGSHLFVCVDDPRVPASTNMLEGFFGRAKRPLRRACGARSTTNSVAQNLGEDYLMAFARMESAKLNPALPCAPLRLDRFLAERARIAVSEAPATRRRSQVRYFAQRIAVLRAAVGLAPDG